MDQVDEYLDRWRTRFELFESDRPFYQVPDLDLERYERPVIALVSELNLADRTLFEHAVDDRPPWLSPARAARELIAHQTVALGGLVSFDEQKHRAAKGAPLSKGAMTLVRGENLFETLMLNLHWYDPDQDEPFESQPTDKPAWERDDVARPEDRPPDGYLDYLTWQSRRIRLHPEETPDGGVGVRSVVIMKGYNLPGWWNEEPRDPMLGYRRNRKARGKADPWDPIAFRPDRAFWRDSLPLYQSVQSKDREFHRPPMLDWLADLSWEYGYLDRSQTRAVDIYGLSSDRQKIHLWRHERFPLPLRYLRDDRLFATLQHAVNQAEEAGSAVRRSTWSLARLLLAPEADLQDGRDPDRTAVSALAERFETGRAYWAQLDQAFAELLVDLAGDRDEDRWGNVEYGKTVLPVWRQRLREAAVHAFDGAIAGLDLSARELKAAARADRGFRYQLAIALNERDGDTEDGKEDSNE